MKEIYLINKGDSVEKAKSELQINGEYVISKDKIQDCNYIEIKGGSNNIIKVYNYLPNYKYVVKSGETIMDIMARGYSIQGVSNVEENDIIIVSKPKSIRYVVKPLEKLIDISKKYNIDMATIIETNNLATDKLFVGQILWL